MLRRVISEFTPYEFWCEELEAGIPTFSLGRHFYQGRSLVRQDGLGTPERKPAI